MHQPTGRTLDYGALVPAAAKLSVPKGESLRFKDRAAWKFVGQDTSTYDQKDIVTGKAQFGLDVFREGMVHASIEHPPVLGGTVRSVDDAGREEGARRAADGHAGHVQAAARDSRRSAASR